MSALSLNHGCGRPASAYRRRLRSRRSRNAVAAMEFGLIAPVMVVMVFGVFELARAAILWEQVWNASRVIAESASTLAIQPDSSAQLTPAQANQALSAIFAEIPWLRGIVGGGSASGSAAAVLTSVNYASDQSSNCTSNCPYVATVQWSKAYGYPGFNTPLNSTNIGPLRPCGTLTQLPAGARFGTTTIPTQQVSATLSGLGVNVPDAFIIADVQLTYRLLLPINFFNNGNVTFSASSFVPVRTNVANALNIWATLTERSDPTNPNDRPALCCPTDPCR